jgi:hypothetical protein
MAMREISPVTTVTVKVNVPVHLFKQLNASAHEGFEVGQMILELAKMGLTKPARHAPHVGSRSRYTSVVGAKMLRLRDLNRSVGEVAAAFGMSTAAAGAWLRRAEAECRERALRDAA